MIAAMNTLSAEAERRLNNIVNLGIVIDVNYDDALCRVQVDGNETDWLPFGAARMGNVKIWNPPAKGEQVLVFSENGELDTAVATGSFDYDNYPMPSTNANSVEVHCKDGAVFSYDHSSHQLSFSLPAGSSTTVRSDDVTFNCSNYTINCDNYSLNSSSNDQNGTLVINDTPYLEHTHSNVKSGPSSTGGVNG